MKELTHVSLFSGIGGADLAAEVAGFKTTAQVEINEYCRNILSLRFPDSKQYNDVTSVKGEDLLNDSNGHINVLSGGFPCQPISVCGQKKGSKDTRWMWDDFYRIIRETQPDWVVIENSPRIYVIQEFSGIKRDLEESGYEMGCFRIQASGVGAPHVRERAFIVANSKSESRLQASEGINTDGSEWDSWEDAVCSNERFKFTDECVVTNSESIRLQEVDNFAGRILSEKSRPACDCKLHSRRGYYTKEIGQVGYNTRLPDWSQNPPAICRMDDGVPPRLDKPRLQALGNAIVPRVIYPIFKSIYDIYNNI